MQSSSAISVVQIVLSVFLIIAVLLQQRGNGLSAGILGGAGGSFHTKRGLEKTLYVATIVIGVLFVGTSALALIIR